MGKLSPGGTELIEKALQLAGMDGRNHELASKRSDVGRDAGDGAEAGEERAESEFGKTDFGDESDDCGLRILDVGCGLGDTAAYIAGRKAGEERPAPHATVIGIDSNADLIAAAKQAHTEIDFRVMGAEMLDFDARTFDCVVMECSLSLVILKADALFEAWCVLKPGGKLIITDLYLRNPDPERVKAMIVEEKARAEKPKVEGACGDNIRPSYVMLDGAFVLDGLAGMCEDIGFEIEQFEDETRSLGAFAAQAVLDCGSVENCFRRALPEGVDLSAVCPCSVLTGGASAKDIGYFLMVLKRPESDDA